MKQHDLASLVTPPNTNSISGRDLGTDYAKKVNLLEDISQGIEIEFVIDDQKIKAINDSFIKGLFSKVFEEHKTVEKVQKIVTINGNNHFKQLFLKNWTILENIYNV